MGTRFLSILLMLAALAEPAPAAAMSAEAFLASLESITPNSADEAAFHAYLRGTMDTMVLYTRALDSGDQARMICVPSGTDFDLDDLRAMVAAALDARPEDAGKPLPLVVIDSFAENYPCP